MHIINNIPELLLASLIIGLQKNPAFSLKNLSQQYKRCFFALRPRMQKAHIHHEKQNLFIVYEVCLQFIISVA